MQNNETENREQHRESQNNETEDREQHREVQNNETEDREQHREAQNNETEDREQHTEVQNNETEVVLTREETIPSLTYSHIRHLFDFARCTIWCKASMAHDRGG